jgi:hypothetical protein
MQNTSGDGHTYDIWGKFLSGVDLSIVTSDFEIVKESNTAFWTPRVAWNSKWNQYLVIYNPFDLITGLAVSVADMILDHK